MGRRLDVTAEGRHEALLFDPLIEDRVNAAGAARLWAAERSTNAAPVYWARCGHGHPWGVACSISGPGAVR